MNKIKVKKKDSRMFVKVKVSDNNISFDDVENLDKNFIRELMKIQKIKKNYITYVGNETVSLEDYLKKGISKHEFYLIVEQIIELSRIIEQHSLDLNNILLDFNYIFINSKTTRMKYIYLPVKFKKSTVDLLDFLKELTQKIIPIKEQNDSYIKDFYYYADEFEVYDADLIEYIVKKEDRQAVNAIKKTVCSPTYASDRYLYNNNNQSESSQELNLNSNNEQRQILRTMYPVVEYDDEKTGLLINAEAKTELFTDNSEFGTSVLIEDDNLFTQVLKADDDSDIDINIKGLDSDDFVQTSLLSEGGLDEIEYSDETALLNEKSRYPCLTRLINNEVILIDKPVFRIGKERSYVDYFISNNNTISRSHADIITRNDRYFIVDLNSKNRTYVNERIIPDHIETEIYDNDNIRLSNEEFIFNV